MKLLFRPIFFIYGFTFITLNSCGDRGCTDPSAVNYDSSVRKDDGGCIYNVQEEIEVEESCGSFTLEDNYILCGKIDNEEVMYSNYSFSTIKYIGMTQGSDTIDFIFSSTVSLINSSEHTFVLSNGELSNVGFDITESDYVNFIQTQKFSTETDNSVVPPKPKNGLILYWYDIENEKKWSTSYGSADQSNSEILVIDLERDKQNPDYFKVLYQLNCKLYNPTGTKVLDVNNLRYLGKLPYK